MAVLLIMIAIVCGVTALFDMANNGNVNAAWAPWGISIAALSGTLGYAMVIS